MPLPEHGSGGGIAMSHEELVTKVAWALSARLIGLNG
jgi:hypothetical protein